MKTLEACYEIEFSKINFVERKIRITHPKTILIGPPKTGKSYLIYDYLSNFESKEYLYINLKDFRNYKEEIFTLLDEFVKKNLIKVLVIENYEFDFKLPVCDSIIITSSINKKLFGFKILDIYALDFEEYLLHDNKHQNTTNSFNFFLKYGNLPEVISLDENKKINRLQEIMQLYCKNETELEVLKLLVLSIDEKKSILQLFNTLKQKIKISKDKFYELCKFYESNKLIFFVEKYQQQKATKKLYAYNHALLTSVSHTKKFKNEFTNMVFLELYKNYKNIYYLDKVDFYIEEENILILTIPFFNNLLLNTITRKVYAIIDELKIRNVFIITIGNNESFFYNNTEISVLPFYEWAVQ